MDAIAENILQRIGDTHLLALRHIAPANCARILLKLENENPTGSMKDRMALAVQRVGTAVLSRPRTGQRCEPVGSESPQQRAGPRGVDARVAAAARFLVVVPMSCLAEALASVLGRARGSGVDRRRARVQTGRRMPNRRLPERPEHLRLRVDGHRPSLRRERTAQSGCATTEGWHRRSR
jgi:hypothetical protein